MALTGFEVKPCYVNLHRELKDHIRTRVRIGGQFYGAVLKPAGSSNFRAKNERSKKCGNAEAQKADFQCVSPESISSGTCNQA